MQEDLLTGCLDIALLYNPVVNPKLETLPLMEEDLLLIGPRQTAAARRQTQDPPTAKTRAQCLQALSLRAVSALPLIIPSRPNAIRMVVETAMAGIGCKPCIELEIDGVGAILELVADGAGYAILPRYALVTATRPGAFVAHPIEQPRLISRLALATAAGRATTQTQQAMLELIQQVASEVLQPSRSSTAQLAA